MKVLGLSFGRKMKSSDILVKQALLAAQEQGTEVKFINVVDKKIGHCTGCAACSIGRDQGKQIRCIVKDDYLEIENEVLEADGIVLAVPVYSVGPTGQLKNFVDRFGAAHDRAFCTAEQNKRIAKGDVELLDARLFKDRYVAYISVGGAWTQNWVAFGLPTLHMFGMSAMMKTVGQLDAYDMGRTANPVLDEQLMGKVSDLGRHLAQSIGKPYADVQWLGEEGTCPYCHNRLLSITGKGTTVECPSCGIEGKLTIVNDEIQVNFPASQLLRARGTFPGLEEHYLEIMGMKDIAIPKIMANKEKIDAQVQFFKEFQSTY